MADPDPGDKSIQNITVFTYKKRPNNRTQQESDRIVNLLFTKFVPILVVFTKFVSILVVFTKFVPILVVFYVN